MDESTQEVTPEQPQTEPWNPPAADMDFDKLFTADDGESLHDTPVEPTRTTEPEPEVPAEAQEPQATTPSAIPEIFLKTGTGTVYKTSEDAIKGIEEKDRLVNDLRAKVIAISGVDPLKKNSPEVTPRSKSYLNDPEAYAEDLTKAAMSKNFKGYQEAQLRLFDEYAQARFGHILPKMERMGRQDAVDKVASEVPAFKTFYGSEDYNKALDRHPTLKEAIQRAESSPEFQETYLPDMYKTIWDVSVALKTSEPTNKGTQVPQSQTPTPSRMPMDARQQPRLQVPDRHSPAQAQPGLNNSAGRKALIAELEAKGIKDVSF